MEEVNVGMTISYDKFTRDVLDEIKEWFEDTYGFSPTYSQLANFCIHTIVNVPDIDLIEKEQERRVSKYINLIIDESHSVNISEANTAKLNSLMQIFKDTYYNTNILFTAIVVYRRLSLPNGKKKSDWSTYKLTKSDVGVIKRPDKERYKRRILTLS